MNFALSELTASLPSRWKT